MSRAHWQLVVLLVSVGAAVTAQAHHSFSTYDTGKMETVTGTVREFQWVNPHSWLYITAPDAKGVLHDVGLEGSGVINLKREGWSKNSFKPGDKVTVYYHPHKDGTPGGAFAAAITAAGKKLGNLDVQLTTPTATAPGAATAPK